MKSFTAAEVSKHDKEDDLWTVINGDVYVSHRCTLELVARELTFPSCRIFRVSPTCTQEDQESFLLVVLPVETAQKPSSAFTVRR